MSIRDEIVDVPAMNIDGLWYDVSVQLWHDGTKYAGRVWFSGAGTGEGGMPGRRLFYGATRDEVLERVRELTEQDMRGQFRSAMVDRRRYLPLRALTDEILHNIRLLNRVAVEWRTGMAAPEPAEAEMRHIEERLHELVNGLRAVAGVEGEPRA
ncbi:MAG TPA: hypothetical protein VFS05_06990 [Gemmatimonadaceae bacterium]|nr:hypothetical protein [Gemmatimonadaceae bacterium]